MYFAMKEVLFKAGIASWKNKKVVVLNKFLQTEGRINTLIDLIPQLEINTEILSEESKKVYMDIISKLETEENGAESKVSFFILHYEFYICRVSYPALKITFLGTGTSSGVPMIGCDCEVCTSTDKKDKRLRSSILVQSAKTTIVVDTGPDFRYQMLREKIKHLDAVIFTHPHKDHLAGLDDIRAFNFFSKKPMEVYADSLTEEAVRRDFYYAFSDTKYPGIPEINMNTITLIAFYCW